MVTAKLVTPEPVIPEDHIVLEMSKAEAHILYDLAGNISGGYDDPDILVDGANLSRELMTSIWDQLGDLSISSSKYPLRDLRLDY